MKKVILSMMAIVVAASANAQFYAKAGLGLNMAAASETLGFNQTTTDAEVVNGSFGKGLAPVLGIGYMLNSHFGIELSASYLLGGKIETKSTTQNATDAYEMKAKGINILPALVLKGGNADSKLRPYMRAGLVVSPGAKITEKNTYTTTGANASKQEMTTEYKTKLGLGYTGAVGLAYHINKMTSIWVEAAATAASASMKSAEITVAKLNDVDVLSDLTADEKSWNYSDKVSSTSKDQLATKNPFSSIGLGIGVAFTFGAK